jgi:hypothetical protein
MRDLAARQVVGDFLLNCPGRIGVDYDAGQRVNPSWSWSLLPSALSPLSPAPESSSVTTIAVNPEDLNPGDHLPLFKSGCLDREGTFAQDSVVELLEVVLGEKGGHKEEGEQQTDCKGTDRDSLHGSSLEVPTIRKIRIEAWKGKAPRDQQSGIREEDFYF